MIHKPLWLLLYALPVAWVLIGLLWYKTRTRYPSLRDIDEMARSNAAIFAAAMTYGPYEQHRDAYVKTGDLDELAAMVEHVR